MKPALPRTVAKLCGAFAVVLACLPFQAVAQASPAEALKARYSQFTEQLARNDFQRAMHIDSSETGNTLRGEIHAVLEHPFARVSGALSQPAPWCDVLILPFNTKYCRAATANGAPVLQMRIGRKYDQPLKDAFALDFRWDRVAVTPEYFETRLYAPAGPVGTRDYRILVAAVPLDANRTFLRLSYTYSYGMAGKLALQGYLATAGADKVGFSVTGRNAQGEPVFIDGVRAVVERNAMRYYLAIDAYLASLSAPPGEQVERRIQAWFNATERHARQLHEMDRSTYVGMKRQEYERQQVAM